MGSNSKKSRTKEKESRKRHRSRSRSNSVEIVREKRRHHHHKKHHKDKRHRSSRNAYESDGNGYDAGGHSPSQSPPSAPPIITIHDDDDDVYEETESTSHETRRVKRNRHSSQSSPSPERRHNHETDEKPRHERDATPEPHEHHSGGGVVESMSIEETNKLRAKLGLKPLQIDDKSEKTSSSDNQKKKDDYGEFYHKPATNISDKTYQEKLRERFTNRKQRRAIEEKLAQVKSLGASDSEDDVDSWVQKNRRVQKEKEQAIKREKMLAELDEELGVGQLVEAASQEKRNKAYTQKHLRGLRVEHDVDDLKEGATTILTLKDQDILAENDDDVLVNVNLLDNERYAKNIQRKKQKLDYNPYENEEVDEFGNLQRKDLLYKYNEEIEGEKKKTFTIGTEASLAEKKHQTLLAIRSKLEHKRIESLAMPELKLASDYYSEAEMVKFKKPSKKVRKLRPKGKILKASDLEAQIRAEDAGKSGKDLGSRSRPGDGDSSIAMEIDDVPAVDIKPDQIKYELDDDLEQALNKARKLKTQPKRFARIEPIKIEPDNDEEVPSSSADDLGSIVLNSTAEFCRTLGDIPTYGRAGNRDEEEDLLDFEREMDLKAEAPDTTNDSSNNENLGGSWSAVDIERKSSSSRKKKPEVVVPDTPILDEEPDVGAGVANALRLALSKGYLDKEDTNRPSTSRFAHLQAKNYSIEDKAHVDDEKFGRRDRYAGPLTDFKEKDTYKPNVKLEYIDDEGHVLNAKEAFRYLSHKFHGKGPGKNKIEKRIKKNEQEGLMKKMSSTDTPLGTLTMLQAKQKETQSSYIVLSGSKHTHSTTISKMKR